MFKFSRGINFRVFRELICIRKNKNSGNFMELAFSRFYFSRFNFKIPAKISAYTVSTDPVTE